LTLTTERLRLRPLETNDFAAVHKYCSDIGNLRYMLFGPNGEDATRAFIADRISKTAMTPRTNYAFAACLKESGVLIGSCELDVKGEQGELGWILDKDYWKNGYGTELAAELIRFGFSELGLHRIYATCDAENYGSYRVMERNRMRREGLFIKGRPTRDGWRDELLYARLKEEWLK